MPYSLTNLFLTRISKRELTAFLCLALFSFNAFGQVKAIKTEVQAETWTGAESATCAGGVIATTGNSSVSGSYGNIRTFSGGGINVKASAFSRKNSTGAWETAFLGAFGPGLGVTNRGEDGNSSTHKVDNIGDRVDYVLFEFDQTVVVNRAFLDSIGADSDVTVWVGTAAVNPYTNHLTLSDSLLGGFGSEDDDVSNNLSRWADFNAGSESGNVLVISASVSDTTPDDEFKIGTLNTQCAPLVTPCAAGVFNMEGSSAGSGTHGNIRSYTTGSINVKASGFSRRKSDGLWETGYLGVFGTGLGVTDRGEGDGSSDRHKLDNLGDRDNYILFEFDRTIVVDRVFLDSVGADSDATVWVGSANNPYNNHLSLNDALLTGFGSENNNASNNAARWADINGGSAAGNVLVIAASTASSTEDDAFKVRHLDVKCAQPPAKVTIIKEVQGLGGASASAQSFPFTATNFGTNNFSLSDQNSLGPDRITNSAIYNFGAANAITVTESQMSGWTLLAINCVETGGIQNSTVAQRTATIIVEPGETVVCTFKNGQHGTTAAPVNVSGRAVSADGSPIAGALMVLTNASTGAQLMTRTTASGQYSFVGVESTEFYTLSASHKRYVFAPDTQFFTAMDDLTLADFVSVQ